MAFDTFRPPRRYQEVQVGEHSSNSKGALVGITTFLLKDAQNLNFAIAAEEYWR
jgi:hypothetical protein